MARFTVTYRTEAGKQFTRTATAKTAKEAVEHVRVQQSITSRPVREIVQVLEWPQK